MSLNCLLLNMNSTNETFLFDRFLIMYDFVCFVVLSAFCILLCTCANVICIKLLLTYLLTYLRVRTTWVHWHYQQSLSAPVQQLNALREHIHY